MLKNKDYKKFCIKYQIQKNRIFISETKTYFKNSMMIEYFQI